MARRAPSRQQPTDATLKALEGPTHALGVTFNRLADEYFSVAENLGLSAEGLTADQFFTVFGRVLAQVAKSVVDLGASRDEEALIVEYLKAVNDGAFEHRVKMPVVRLN